MKLIYRIGADVVWVVHGFVVIIVMFGWVVPALYPVYMAVLAGTPLSTIALGHCFLSRWEYELRRRYNPAITYDFSYQSHYTYRLTQERFRTSFVRMAVIAFVSASLAIDMYFQYFFA